MKAFNVMTTNLVAAREGSTAREIGTKLLETLMACPLSTVILKS
jgi:hypothetical protein